MQNFRPKSYFIMIYPAFFSNKLQPCIRDMPVVLSRGQWTRGSAPAEPSMLRNTTISRDFPTLEIATQVEAQYAISRCRPARLRQPEADNCRVIRTTAWTRPASRANTATSCANPCNLCTHEDSLQRPCSLCAGNAQALSNTINPKAPERKQSLAMRHASCVLAGWQLQTLPLAPSSSDSALLNKERSASTNNTFWRARHAATVARSAKLVLPVPGAPWISTSCPKR